MRLPIGLPIVRGMVVDMGNLVKTLTEYIMVVGEADGQFCRVHHFKNSTHPEYRASAALDVQQWREYECGLTAHLIHCPVTEADGPGMEW